MALKKCEVHNNYGRFVYLLLIGFLLISFGCSQHRFVNQNELINEIAKLPSNSKISICDSSGQKYEGFIINMIDFNSDSACILIVENANENEKNQFIISSICSKNCVKSVSIPYKAEADEIVIGGLFGMLIGAVSGVYIGDAVSGKYDDTLAPKILGGIIGSITGFITGAVLVELIQTKKVFVIKDISYY